MERNVMTLEEMPIHWDGTSPINRKRSACRIATLAEPRDECVAAMNTDREVWRREDDYYSPSIHVTASGRIGINVNGRVIVMSVENWHQLAVGVYLPPNVSDQRAAKGTRDHE